MFDFIEPGYLAWMAGALYALGYLVINQVVLRLLVLVGTGFYIWYYFVVGNVPLWEAIWVSVILGVANIIGLANLYFHKSRLYIPRAHRDIYDRSFAHMPPAEFRKMMQIGQRKVLDRDRIITREGRHVTDLYYIVEGHVTIEKLGEVFRIPEGVFVGEIAYLTGRGASATTHLPEGAEVLVWSFENLRKCTARRPRFKLAFEAMISRDLADKVSLAVAPHHHDLNNAARELIQA